MSDRIALSEMELEDVVGGNITYTWFGGKGTCGLNGNHKWNYLDKALFESTMKDCLENKGMSDVDTLKYLIAARIIWK